MTIQEKLDLLKNDDLCFDKLQEICKRHNVPNECTKEIGDLLSNAIIKEYCYSKYNTYYRLLGEVEFKLVYEKNLDDVIDDYVRKKEVKDAI